MSGRGFVRVECKAEWGIGVILASTVEKMTENKQSEQQIGHESKNLVDECNFLSDCRVRHRTLENSEQEHHRVPLLHLLLAKSSFLLLLFYLYLGACALSSNHIARCPKIP